MPAVRRAGHRQPRSPPFAAWRGRCLAGPATLSHLGQAGQAPDHGASA